MKANVKVVSTSKKVDLSWRVGDWVNVHGMGHYMVFRGNGISNLVSLDGGLLTSNFDSVELLERYVKGAYSVSYPEVDVTIKE